MLINNHCHILVKVKQMTNKKDRLKEHRKIIEDNVAWVDIKPYSHNIIGLTLAQIDAQYGREEANKCITDFKLEDKGWSKVEE